MTSTIEVTYDPESLNGLFRLQGDADSAVWNRLKQSALNLGKNYRFEGETIRLPWQDILTLLREFGPVQRTLDFRFKPIGEAKDQIETFIRHRREAENAKGTMSLALEEEEVERRLSAAGFVRKLRPFQMRDLRRLLALENGANFSVPGAGKTTVSLALHILTRRPGQHLLVVCPKTAFPAWREVVDECMDPNTTAAHREQFTVLQGQDRALRAALESGATRFVVNYDLLIQNPGLFQSYLTNKAPHLLLDESHRMKAGFRSQRGTLLLSFAHLPIRRDILSGTPMPQSESDISSQLKFLWPGMGYGEQIDAGRPPREVLGNLYVRTTKDELGLTPPVRRFVKVPMAEGQLALHAIIKNETYRELTSFRAGRGGDIARARKSVMRLLQLSANPTAALGALTADMPGFSSGILDQVLSEGPSTKMRAVVKRARQLAQQGLKVVIWTIFTDTILQMEGLLADLNPVTLYGATPTGEPTDPDTREGKLRRFHEDSACSVLVANPAAAGEGISLHRVCHDALYLDRSYVTTHYLQSIDRIHRLGLPPGVETRIEIYQTTTAPGLGCIDHSVSRRLAKKIRELQKLLNDPDLHRIALDEEDAEEPVDFDITEQDLYDLIDELENKVVYDETDDNNAA